MFGGRLWLRAVGVALFAAVLPLVIFGCSGKPKDNPDADWPKPGPRVVVSFAPLYCFAANVAGDDATVKNAMTTTGPHDFNPTEQDARLVSKAELFFVVGLGLDEDKAEKMKGTGNDKLKIIELGEKLPKDKLVKAHHDHDGHAEDKDHKHGEYDPHLWLSPDHAVLMVNIIRDELKAADPAHAAGYDQRAAAYVAKLNQLKANGQAQLKDKKDRRLVSFHDSLAYFSKAFDLKVEGVLTKKPGQEPDQKEMKELIEICTKNPPTRLIAVEPQFSTSNSGETLRKELVAKGVKDTTLVEIDTLETVKPDELTLDWYEKRMNANLAELAGKMK